MPSSVVNEKQKKMNVQFEVAELETKIATRYLDNQFNKMQQELNESREEKKARRGSPMREADGPDKGRYEYVYDNYDLRKLQNVVLSYRRLNFLLRDLSLSLLSIKKSFI